MRNSFWRGPGKSRVKIEKVQTNTGYLIAAKTPDGSIGRPVGDEAMGSMAIFEELAIAQRVKKECEIDSGLQLSIFQVNVMFCGEVIA